MDCVANSTVHDMTHEINKRMKHTHTNMIWKKFSAAPNGTGLLTSYHKSDVIIILLAAKQCTTLSMIPAITGEAIYMQECLISKF